MYVCMLMRREVVFIGLYFFSHQTEATGSLSELAKSDGVPPPTDDSSEESYSDWLKDFQETRLLDLPIIPASHNSASAKRKSWIGKTVGSHWAQQQSLPIKDQLMLGVRGIDFRLHVREEGEVQISHGFDTTYTFQRGLKEIKEFLEKHTSEFVILFLRIDWDHRLRDALSDETKEKRNKLKEILHQSGIEFAKVSDKSGDFDTILNLFESTATREWVLRSIVNDLQDLVAIKPLHVGSYFKSIKHHFSRKGYGIHEIIQSVKDLKLVEDEEVKSIVKKFRDILKPNNDQEVSVEKLKNLVKIVKEEMVPVVSSVVRRKAAQIEALVKKVSDDLTAKLGKNHRSSVERIVAKLTGLGTVSEQEIAKIVNRIQFIINALEQQFIDIKDVVVSQVAGKVLLYTQIADDYETEVIPASDVSIPRIDFHSFKVVDIWRNAWINSPYGAKYKLKQHMKKDSTAADRQHLHGVALDITVVIAPPYWSSNQLNKWFIKKLESRGQWNQKFLNGQLTIGVFEIDFVNPEIMKRIMDLIYACRRSETCIAHEDKASFPDIAEAKSNGIDEGGEEGEEEDEEDGDDEEGDLEEKPIPSAETNHKPNPLSQDRAKKAEAERLRKKIAQPGGSMNGADRKKDGEEEKTTDDERKSDIKEDAN